MTHQETSEMLDKVINLIFMPWRLENANTDQGLPRRLCLTMLKHFVDGMREHAPFDDLYYEALDNVLLEYGQCMKVKKPCDDEDAMAAKQYSNLFFAFMIFAAPLSPTSATEEEIETVADNEANLIEQYEELVDTSGYKRAKRYKDKAVEFMTAVFSGQDSIDNYLYADTGKQKRGLGKKQYASPMPSDLVKVPMTTHALLPEPNAEPVKVAEAKAAAADAQAAQPAVMDDETREKILRAVFDFYKFKIPGKTQYKYKWRHLYHAMLRAEIIEQQRPTSFAKLTVRWCDNVSLRSVQRSFQTTSSGDAQIIDEMYNKILKIIKSICPNYKSEAA